jgi:uncharacterized membrane protein
MTPPTQSTAVALAPSRLSWIDWMRGFACILMFQTHCYDAWLGGDARNTSFLQGSQLLGTLPAPSFLFLAGVSFALVTDKLIRRNLSTGEITRTMLYRGAEIFAFGLLFRLQEYIIAWGWAPWSDLVRVDVLNIIGLSMMMMALLCGITLTLFRKWSSLDQSNSARSPQSNVSHQNIPSVIPQPPESKFGFNRCSIALSAAAIAVATAIALLTPPLYTTWRPTWLPWPLESYIDGCHNLGGPQSWLFPIFPWSAFAFAGLAAGFMLFTPKARAHTTKALALLGAIGFAAIFLAYGFDHSPIHLYSTYDYWHTSPNFLMTRVGLLLVVAFLIYAWCEWGGATRGFSPLMQLGQTSLLVYWVHIEFVYGRYSLLPKRAESIAGASMGLLEITVFMLILSLLRTKVDWKKIIHTLTSKRIRPA